MNDKLFYQLEELNLLHEEQNEIAEALGRLTGLPNATEGIVDALIASVERSSELFQSLSNIYSDKHSAILAYVAECRIRKLN